MSRRTLARSVPAVVAVTVAAAAAALLLVAAPAYAGSRALPDRIWLPDGSQPEGLTITNRGRFFTGSLADGTIYVGDVRSRRVRVFAPGGEGLSATGMDVRNGLLWVAGGETGKAWVYRRNGRLIRTYDLNPTGGFINDVVVTRNAAYFTDSFEPFLYRVPIRDDGKPGGSGSADARPVTGDLEYEDGFNANGIDVIRGRARFVIAQTNTGELFLGRPSGRTHEIDLHGEAVEIGDGVLVRDRLVFVVQNFPNLVAKVRLSEDLSRGRVVSRTTDPDFDVPTSIDAFRGALYLVNARFDQPARPGTNYWIAPIPRP